MIADIFYSILILTVTALGYFIRKNKKLFGGFAPTPSTNCRPRPPVGLQLPPSPPASIVFGFAKNRYAHIF